MLGRNYNLEDLKAAQPLLPRRGAVARVWPCPGIDSTPGQGGWGGTWVLATRPWLGAMIFGTRKRTWFEERNIPCPIAYALAPAHGTSRVHLDTKIRLKMIFWGGVIFRGASRKSRSTMVNHYVGSQMWFHISGTRIAISPTKN